MENRWLTWIADYGLLTAISGRLPSASSSALLQDLEAQSEQTGLTRGELLLSWAYYCLDGIVITTSSKPDRAAKTVQLVSQPGPPVPRSVYDSIEAAAKQDGPVGKVFYGHPHMEKARGITP